MHLTQRDLTILTMVYEYHGCAAEHIARRFFPGRARSTYYERLTQLTRHEYLTMQRTVSLSGQGNGRSLYYLGRAARPVLAELYAQPVASIPRSRPASTSSLHIAHHLAICDVRLAFELAAEAVPQATIADFRPEALCRKSPLVVTDTEVVGATTQTRKLRLIPDGVFRLEYLGRAREVLLEVDMATTYATQMRLKLRGYLRRTGPAALSPVFLITTTTHRLDQLRSFIQEEAEATRANPTIFFLTTFAALSPVTALTAPIWHQAGVSSPVSILPRADQRMSSAS